MDFEIELIGPNGKTFDETKWSIQVAPTTTWTQVQYGVLTMIKECDRQIPINYTTAVLAIQPNKQKHVTGSGQTPMSKIFMVKDHMDTEVLADRVTDDLRKVLS